MLTWTRDRLTVYDGKMTGMQLIWSLSDRWIYRDSKFSSLDKPDLPSLTLNLETEQDQVEEEDQVNLANTSHLPQLQMRQNITADIKPTFFISTPTNQDSLDWELPPFNQQRQCVACKDKKSNRCRRFVAGLLKQKDKNRGLEECGEPRSGAWSGWRAVEECGVAEQVFTGESFIKCGRGFQTERRDCEGRTFGGKFCEVYRNGSHVETSDGVQTRNLECNGNTCPGKSYRIYCGYCF